MTKLSLKAKFVKLVFRSFFIISSFFYCNYQVDFKAIWYFDIDKTLFKKKMVGACHAHATV